MRKAIESPNPKAPVLNLQQTAKDEHTGQRSAIARLRSYSMPNSKAAIDLT
jgi:hypothetical protein